MNNIHTVQCMQFTVLQWRWLTVVAALFLMYIRYVHLNVCAQNVRIRLWIKNLTSQGSQGQMSIVTVLGQGSCGRKDAIENR